MTNAGRRRADPQRAAAATPPQRVTWFFNRLLFQLTYYALALKRRNGLGDLLLGYGLRRVRKLGILFGKSDEHSGKNLNRKFRNVFCDNIAAMEKIKVGNKENVEANLERKRHKQ